MATRTARIDSKVIRAVPRIAANSPNKSARAAVPFVVAAAALVLEASADPEDAEGAARLRQALRDGAWPLAGQKTPHDPVAGHGLLQAPAALTRYLAAAQATLPAASPRPQWP